MELVTIKYNPLRDAAIGAAMLGLGSGMRGVQAALPSNSPKIALPTYVMQMKRRQRVKFLQKLDRTKENRRGQGDNRERLFFSRGNGPDPLIRKMTNWQRNQWVRAGRDPAQVKRFANLPHWKAA